MPYSPNTAYNDYQEEAAKLKVILNNPAFLTIVKMNCDLFSLGKIYVKDTNGEIIPNHPLNELISEPNPFQTTRQLKWDYMFWLMMGNAYLFAESFISTSDNILYFLDPSKMQFPKEMTEQGDKLFLSKVNADNFKKNLVKYKYDNGDETSIPFNKVIHYTDLSSTTKQWFKGSSVIDALFKVLSNSELALDAKNTNLLFAGKYMVAGKVGENDLDNPMMSQGEKKDIEQKTMRNTPVTAIKSMIEIKRFVEDMGKLKLDEAYVQDAFKIGRIYGVPKDVIEAEVGSGATYENQEKARGAHVDYVMSPKGEDFVDLIMKRFNFTGDACMEWTHLPFNYYSRMQKEESEKRKSEALLNLLQAGVDPEDAKIQLGYNFTKKINYERPNQSTQQGTE
jgi:hypothetical protein